MPRKQPTHTQICCCAPVTAKLSMSLPLPNCGGNSRRQSDWEDKSAPTRHSDVTPPSDHGSRPSHAAADTMRSIPLEQDSHLGPLDTGTHASRHSRDDRPRSPNTQHSSQKKCFYPTDTNRHKELPSQPRLASGSFRCQHAYFS